ncbi:hypothetical protein AVEN_173852-1 [Araneus ventricosus]|uniref:Uncharacterized protein n=1 Tax=Araneus ventricosus TaxID=182803 RepID=A0A4Y2UXL5_ARAVE|nr:hypothetical protein AVEN_173852-1 [Araneus ventricosus]
MQGASPLVKLSVIGKMLKDNWNPFLQELEKLSARVVVSRTQEVITPILSGCRAGMFDLDMVLGIAFIFGIRNIPIEAVLSCTFAAHSAAHSAARKPTSHALTISGTVSFAPTSNEMQQVV